MLDPWRSVAITTIKGTVWLVHSFDAACAEREGTYERMTPFEACGHLAEARPADVRALLLAGSPDSGFGSNVRMGDEQLVHLAERKLRDGELAVLRKGGGSRPATTEQDREAAVVRALAPLMSGGHLIVDGRRLRAVASYELDRVPGRDDYEVVRRAEAERLLEKAASTASSPALRTALTEARAQLSPDFVPPSRPSGIVLLGHRPRFRRSGGDEAPPVTPAQMKRAVAKHWIEIVVETTDESPFNGRVRLQFADGRIETANASEGVLRYDGILPGSVRVSLPDLDGPAWDQAAPSAD